MRIKKGCPFCGTRIPIVSRDCCVYNLVCEHCGATGPNGSTISEAMKLWDQRRKQKSLPRGSSILSKVFTGDNTPSAIYEVGNNQEQDID